MAEELRYYYNEGIDIVVNTENLGTSLENGADKKLHVRKVKISIHAENIALSEGAFVEVTKRAARSQAVGLQETSAGRCGITGSKTALTSTADMNAWSQTTDVYARGQLTLETAERLYTHLTELKDGGTYDVFIDVWWHF